MTEPKWPHVGEKELRLLWELHAPDFLRLDDVERDLPKIRDKFLAWLDSSGIELAPERTRMQIRRRVRLVSVGLVRRGDSAETQVSMALNGSNVDSSRTGPALPDQILRLAAEATLDALTRLVPGITFGLEDAFRVEPVHPEQNPVAMVLVRDTRALARYVGACAISASTPEAAAKATLQAVNRRTEAAVATAVA